MKNNTINKFLDFKKQGAGEVAIKSYEQELRVYINFLNGTLKECSDCLISGITISNFDSNINKATNEEAVNAFIDFLFNKSSYKASTINKKIIVLKDFFKFLYKNGHIKNNPTLDIPVYAPQLNKPTILSPDDVEDIIDSCNSFEGKTAMRDMCIIKLLLTTGLKNNEIRNIKLEDIDVNSGTISINKTIGGKIEQQMVNIIPQVANDLKNYINIERFECKTGETFLFTTHTKTSLSHQALSKIVRFRLLETGLECCKEEENLKPQTLRASYLAYLAHKNVDVLTIHELGRGKTLNTTLRYINLTTENKKAILENAFVNV